MTNLTPLNDNHPVAAVATLQAAFATRHAPSLREQTLALTRGATAPAPRCVARATPRASPRRALTSPLTRARAYA
jgi:hypothetical protein